MPRSGRPPIFTAAQLRRRRNARRARWRAKRGEALRTRENTKARTKYQQEGQEREAAKATARRLTNHFLYGLARVHEALHVVSIAKLDRPPLLFVDAHGRPWHEDFRSAQQLIRDWKREHKKKGHRP